MGRATRSGSWTATRSWSATTGDIEATPTEPTGLFSLDTRFLSKWVLTVDGERLNTLSYDDLQYFESRFFLVPGHATDYVDAKLSIIRERAVGGSFHEKLTILNHDEKAVDLTVRMDAGADFADLFEVKDATSRRRASTTPRPRPTGCGSATGGSNFRRETVISSSRPAELRPQGLRRTRCTWSRTAVGTGDRRADLRGRRRGPGPAAGRDGAAATSGSPCSTTWRSGSRRRPKVDSEHEPLAATYRRSLIDLAALRFAPLSLGGQTLPAAGLPWFMTMFGRDSILTCLQALPFAPELAATTLRILASLQGSRFDDFRDEEPGRILHEMRYGETAAFEEQPHSPYYGSRRRHPAVRGAARRVRAVDRGRRAGAGVGTGGRAALNWIDDYADLAGNGYIWYERRNTETGLENQCWKDSWDSISYADGRLPAFPRATCELQGYAYDAKMRGGPAGPGVLGRPGVRRPAGAGGRRPQGTLQPRLLGGRRGVLRARARRRRPAGGRAVVQHRPPAVERDRRPDRAEKIAEHLVGPRLFTGWGVRTLAEGEARYNPIGYHNGTVWPFDNSFIAWGLRRYGFADEAARIAAASWTRPTSSTAGCPRRSAATPRPRPSTRCSTRRRAARRPGRPGRRCCCCAPCSGWSRTGSTWW